MLKHNKMPRLHDAVKNDYVDVVLMYVIDGDDPDVPDENGFRPIDLCWTYATYQVLVEVGADVNRRRSIYDGGSFVWFGEREHDETGSSLLGSHSCIKKPAQRIVNARRAMSFSVLSIEGLHKGLGMRVVEWALKC